MAADEELQDLLEDVDTLYEDLYEDVGDGRQLLRTSIQEMEERLDKLARRDKEMEASLNDLQRQNEELQQGKSLLVRNISCLFKTAQLEIARKDRSIKELREENERLKSANAQSPAGTHQKSRSRGPSVGAHATVDANISARAHPSSSGRFERHSKEPRNEVQPVNRTTKDGSRERIPLREFRVRFEDEESSMNGKTVHGSGARERAQYNGRDRFRHTKQESQGRDGCGGRLTGTHVEEISDRWKLRKLVPRLPSS